jgi:hypothetical protein
VAEELIKTLAIRHHQPAEVIGRLLPEDAIALYEGRLTLEEALAKEANRRTPTGQLADVAPSEARDEHPTVWSVHTSPLLNDPEWLAGFRNYIATLRDTARDLEAAGRQMPNYRASTILTRWNPFCDGLRAHVLRVVEDYHRGVHSGPRAYSLNRDIAEAYRLACFALDEIAMSADGVIPASMLEHIHSLLDKAEVAARTPTPDPPPKQPAFSAPADPVSKSRRRKGGLPTALIDYMKDRESATYDEIAFHLHGDKQASESAIRKNVERANKELGATASPIRYRCGSSTVYKETSPE